MSLKIEHKKSGNKTWCKATGNIFELLFLSRRVHAPIKTDKGSRNIHIDFSEKRLKGA